MYSHISTSSLSFSRLNVKGLFKKQVGVAVVDEEEEEEEEGERNRGSDLLVPGHVTIMRRGHHQGNVPQQVSICCMFVWIQPIEIISSMTSKILILRWREGKEEGGVEEEEGGEEEGGGGEREGRGSPGTDK